MIQAPRPCSTMTSIGWHADARSGDRDQFRPLENVDNRLRAGGPMLDR
jgi:hypothetical protein